MSFPLFTREVQLSGEYNSMIGWSHNMNSKVADNTNYTISDGQVRLTETGH